MKVRYILSHIAVALLATVVTLFVVVPKQDLNVLKLQQLKAIIDAEFVEKEYDQVAMYDAAAAAMVESLGNRWSYYISAEEYGSYEERRENIYVGIGVTISTREDGYIDIQQVEFDGPAYEAGILPGDILLAVDGADVANMSLDEVRNMVSGKSGTQVQLQLRRGEETITLSPYRGEIPVPVTTGTMLEGNVGLVQIANFDDRCKTETIAVIEELIGQGAKALIFDVRYNPGGYTREMVGLLDYLLPEVVVFRSQDRNGNESLKHSDANCLDMPMAVLLNADSYSAAELFAVGLQEYDAAIVVGEQSMGKCHYQYTYELFDGSAVLLSAGSYTSPKGVNLEGAGVTPDVVVPVDEEMYWKIYAGYVTPQEDPQIQAALNALKTQE